MVFVSKLLLKKTEKKGLDVCNRSNKPRFIELHDIKRYHEDIFMDNKEFK